MSTWLSLSAGVLLLLAVMRYAGIPPVGVPRCTVGVEGTAASLTVEGSQARLFCDEVRRREPGWYEARDESRLPLVCVQTIAGQEYRVHDDGIFKLVGNALCLQLRRRRGA